MTCYGQVNIFIEQTDLSISTGTNLLVKGSMVIKDVPNPAKITGGGEISLHGNLLNLSGDEVFKEDSIGTVRLMGDSDQAIISPDTILCIPSVEVSKTSGNVLIQNDICIKKAMRFNQGLVYLNGGDIVLSSPTIPVAHGVLVNEHENSRITGKLGAVKVHLPEVKPGQISGIGLEIDTTLGFDLQIERRHERQWNAGDGGIHRYFKVKASGSLQNSGFTLHYFDSELDTLRESELSVWGSENGIVWRRKIGLVDPVANTGQANFQDSFSDIILTMSEAVCREVPYVDFGPDTLYLCQGDSMVLDLKNQGMLYQWSTGDTTRTITVKTGGMYFGSALNLKGCEGFDSVWIEMKPNPVADFTRNILGECQQDTAFFFSNSSISSGSITHFLWDFGEDGVDEDTSQAENSGYRYLFEGIKQVRLHVKSDYGCVDSSMKSIVIHPLPKVGFIVSDTICEAQNSCFSDTTVIASGGVFERKWKFGDGNESSLVNPINNYQFSGNYQVVLSVTSNAGCTDSLVKSLEIHPLPVAEFSVDPQCANHPLLFTNQSSLGYYSFWDFGDGESSSSSDPEHLYTTPGLKAVELLVFSVNGCSSDTMHWVMVDTVPVAEFFVDTICQQENVQFINATTGNLFNFWNFGDGNLSTEISPFHHFEQYGIQSVRLISVNTWGCADTLVRDVEVHPGPNAGFIGTSACDGFSVNLLNTSSIISGNLTYSWLFGDSISVQVFSPVHLYEDSGRYQTCLTARSEWGCIDTWCDSIEIFPLPFINFGDSIRTCSSSFVLDAGNSGSDFLWSDNSTNQHLPVVNSGTYFVRVMSPQGCVSRDTATVVLNNFERPELGSDRIVCTSEQLQAYQFGSTYLWSTGSTASAITASISDEYWIQVTDQNGCQGRDTLFLTVMASPQVDLGPDTTICMGETIFPDAQSAGCSYLWNTGQTLGQIALNTTGTFSVQVQDSNGCRTVDTIKLTVELPPETALPDSLRTCGPVWISSGSAHSYLWSTGSTSPSEYIFSTGLVSVQSGSENNCLTFDSVFVEVIPVPVIDLGPDTVLCNGDSIRLQVNVQNQDQVIWTGGGHSDQLVVNSTGNYYAKITNSGNCSAADTIFIRVAEPVLLDLGGDQVLCGTNALSFYAPLSGTFRWSLNDVLWSTDSVVELSEPGTLTLQINQGGCIGTDSINVVQPAHPLRANFLAPSTVNAGDTVQFVQVSSPLAAGSYYWKFGDGVEATDKHPQHVFYLTGSFPVTLTITDGICTDSVTKEINILQLQQDQILPEEPLNYTIRILNSRVYPNPTEGLVMLETLLSESATLHVSCYSADGRLLFLNHLNGISLNKEYDFTEFPAGIYFLMVQTERNTVLHKILLRK